MFSDKQFRVSALHISAAISAALTITACGPAEKAEQAAQAAAVANDVANSDTKTEVAPAPTFSVSGTVNGLGTGNSITLKNNDADPIQISADGNFSFATPVALDGSYSVTTTNPAAIQCSVAQGTGTNIKANARVFIDCSPLNAVFDWATGQMTSNDPTLTTAGFDSTRAYDIRIVLPSLNPGIVKPDLAYVQGLRGLNAASKLSFVLNTRFGSTITSSSTNCTPTALAAGSYSASLKVARLNYLAGLAVGTSGPSWMSVFAPYTINNFEFAWNAGFSSFGASVGGTSENATMMVNFTNASNPSGATSSFSADGTQSGPYLNVRTPAPYVGRGLGISLHDICASGITIN
jgi:hypothetical protein